jgi:hypothetical protein
MSDRKLLTVLFIKFQCRKEGTENEVEEQTLSIINETAQKDFGTHAMTIQLLGDLYEPGWVAGWGRILLEVFYQAELVRLQKAKTEGAELVVLPKPGSKKQVHGPHEYKPMSKGGLCSTCFEIEEHMSHVKMGRSIEPHNFEGMDGPSSFCKVCFQPAEHLVHQIEPQETQANAPVERFPAPDESSHILRQPKRGLRAL